MLTSNMMKKTIRVFLIIMFSAVASTAMALAPSSEISGEAKFDEVQAIPKLIEALDDEDELVRLFARLALVELGALSTRKLTDALVSEKPRVREEADKALDRIVGIGPHPESSELLQPFIDRPEEARIAFAQLKEYIGDVGFVFIPKLMKIYLYEVEKAGNISREDFRKIGLNAPQTELLWKRLVALQDISQQGEIQIDFKSISFFWGEGPAGLRKYISIENKKINKHMYEIYALLQRRPSASPIQEAVGEVLVVLGKPAIKPLVKELIRGKSKVRREIVNLFGSMNPTDAREAIPALMKMLGDKDEEVRYRTCGTLAKIGTEEVARRLTKVVITDESLRIKKAAAYALKRMDVVYTKEAVTELINIFYWRASDSQANFSLSGIIEVLASLGKFAVRELARELEDLDSSRKRSSIRLFVLSTLEKMEPRIAVDALPQLIKVAIYDEDIINQISARVFVAEMGEPAVAPLSVLLEGKHLKVRMEATRMLVNIAEKRGVRSLERALARTNFDVQQRVIEAIDSIDETQLASMFMLRKGMQARKEDLDMSI